MPPSLPCRHDVVVVPVTVTDRSGRFVPDLTAADFEISDGGDRRAVEQFSTERVPVSLGILLDISGSMAQDPKARARTMRGGRTRAARSSCSSSGSDRATKFSSPRSPTRWGWRPRGRATTSSAARVRCASPRGLHGALRRGEADAPAFQRAEHARKVLLVVSDGRDSLVPRISGAPVYRNSPTREQQVQLEILRRQQALRDAAVGAAQRVVNKSGAALYAIGMGTGKGAYVDFDEPGEPHNQFGRLRGGDKRSFSITAAVARIFDELQSQYMLAFEPAHADGKHHDISVTTKNGDLRVRARAGYTAAEKK